ncbi:hypothetical protein LSH36_40g05030 [Paralvinella palmiformis]|uniref:Endoplasmic reticulum-Golgi intermediate compartment protein 3 n=1 Tax=Paralvinella palmiformis TaxID=53620 RepID=A0AAD9K853_9ANNE|nr:hypothetical protein LSH36_40g05030 [Paralvinella palmiformis]
MPSGVLLGKLRDFDAYPKTLEDFRVKTYSGAAVTIISGAFMFILFCMELNYYLTTEIQPELFVDTSKGQKLKINIDVTFPKVGCSFLGLDAMDVSGEQQLDIDHNIFKQRLDASGELVTEPPVKEELGDNSENMIKLAGEKLDPNRCESCYGAESEELKDAYRKKGWAFNNAMDIEQCKRDGWIDKIEEQKNEGCRIYGYIEVNKFNMSHTVNHLSFGTDYPGQVNPLDLLTQIAKSDSMMFQYFVKIVPTSYVRINGEMLETNQYSVTKHQKVVTSGILGEQGLPGMFVTYELSPMLVKYTEKNRSFTHFLTGVCAIVGGVFTVAGLIDSMIYHSTNVLKSKIDLGKST